LICISSQERRISHVASITISSRLLGAPSDVSPVELDVGSKNKRTRVERRQRHPLLADWRWGYRGRRRNLRRSSDAVTSQAFLDWYHPSLLFFIVATYVLSGIDAVLTLTLLEFGIAEEANPFMHLLLAEDIHLFAGVKALATGLGLIWLTVYSNQRVFARLRVNRIIYALFASYSLLVIYEIYLLDFAESVGWPIYT